jgi:inosose dehydratase
LVNRREFIVSSLALGTAWRGLIGTAHAASGLRLPSGQAITFGYASITWNGNDRQAIADIAACGYRGIQLRSNVLQEFGDKPAELKELLDQHHLEFVALSSGNMLIDPAVEKSDQESHFKKAQFVRALGGKYLQLIDERPRRQVVADDYRRMGRLLTELGKRTADIGVTVSYHHHMNALGERPQEVRAVLESSDPKFVKLQLDTAHYQQGGGDPVEAIRQYGDRLSFLHIKDLRSPLPGAKGDLTRSYEFVELGRGKVDLKDVFKALDAVNYKGWAIVELDRVPEPNRTPKDSALISRAYIEKELKLVVGPRPASTTAAAGSEWISLFDGRSLKGWRGYRKADASQTRWRVEDGMLTVPSNDGKDTRGALDLITVDTFTDFELAWEWRVASGGNSGLKYLVLEDMDAAIGHEYQMIDDERHPDALIGPKRQTSALYDVMAASNRPLKPAGELNASRVIVSGTHVEHWLNGVRVLQYELESAPLRAAIAESKFKDVARFGTRQKGHILVQDHGDRVWYRNIRIRRLDGRTSVER